MAETINKSYKSYAKEYFQPAFLICVLVLALAGGGMSIAIKTFGVYLQKEPIYLKKSLDVLDENGLGPYEVISREKITNKEIVKSLGTEDYIQWVLEDTEAPGQSSVKYCLLFITYYNLPDRVPHVPEECYTGSGHQKLTSEGLVFDIEGFASVDGGRVPVRYLMFSSTNTKLWQSVVKFPIFYLLKVNGDYTNSRDDARMALNKNIFGRYSYFCKVEWKFYNPKSGVPVYPDKEQAISAGKKLLGVILPVLEAEHWPVWQD